MTITDKTLTLNIAVFPGDGIGPEIMTPCVQLLKKLIAQYSDFNLLFENLPAGAACYQQTGQSMSTHTFNIARSADAILLGAMGLPDIRYPDGTEISPQLELREKLNLYAGVRPIKTMPGTTPVLNDSRAKELDLVIIRESTEGLFAARNNSTIDNDQIAHDTMVITRSTSERLFDFAFRWTQQRKKQGHIGQLTCVDKANVISGFAFFRKIFSERSLLFNDIQTDYVYVDAAGLKLIKSPWNLDVLVTENMFGDILSDVGGALLGGIGMAPSADIGDHHAVFQPCHGSAPDIVGKDKANPTGMLLSAAMMLEWLGHTHQIDGCTQAANQLTTAIEAVYVKGVLPIELGGKVGTIEMFSKIAGELIQ